MANPNVEEVLNEVAAAIEHASDLPIDGAAIDRYRTGIASRSPIGCSISGSELVAARAQERAQRGGASRILAAAIAG
jgi:hypothetical protein